MSLYEYDNMGIDMVDDEATYRDEVLEERRRRREELIGKFLIIVTSRYQSDLDLYLQDSRYGDGFWTKFISNARGFVDESQALIKAKNLQYNNPRVVLVQADGKLREVYSDGRRIG